MTSRPPPRTSCLTKPFDRGCRKTGCRYFVSTQTFVPELSTVRHCFNYPPAPHPFLKSRVFPITSSHPVFLSLTALRPLRLCTTRFPLLSRFSPHQSSAASWKTFLLLNFFSFDDVAFLFALVGLLVGSILTLWLLPSFPFRAIHADPAYEVNLTKFCYLNHGSRSWLFAISSVLRGHCFSMRLWNKSLPFRLFLVLWCLLSCQKVLSLEERRLRCEFYFQRRFTDGFFLFSVPLRRLN